LPCAATTLEDHLVPVELWTSPAFVEQARAWVADHLPDGVTLTGEWEQPHARPWSSAIRFETSGGRVWFKVNGPGTAHEATLTGVLADVVPDLVPEVLAVDAARGWSLQRDAGPTVRSVWPPEELWERWQTLVQRYAEAQRVLVDHESAVLEAGVPDLRPEALPAQLAALTDQLTSRPVDRGGLTAGQARSLESLAPEYATWCEELATSGPGCSVNHDDLHTSNICAPDGRDVMIARIIDWGDSVWSHPFGVLLATMNSIAFHAGTEITDPRVLCVRDAYLDVYADHGSASERERWVRLARRTGCVSKALSYVRAFEGEPESAEVAEDWPVRAWLLETLDPAVAG
jgi:hypothetical protein